MVQSPYNLPTVHTATFSDLQAQPGQIGQRGLAEDTMVEYVYDGTAWTDTPFRKLMTKSSAPNISMSPNAGSGATGSVSGTNAAGTITITTGLSVAVNPDLFTLTLADGVTFPNKTIIQLQALDNNTIGIMNSVFQSVANAASVTIKAKGASLSVSTTYVFSYQIIGY